MPTTESSQVERPRVNTLLGSEYHGLSIDGEFVYAIPNSQMYKSKTFMKQVAGSSDNYLPPEASEAYWAYHEMDNHGWVYQCQDCGYLSMSSNCGVASHSTHECGNCDGQSWRRVYPRDSLLNVPDEHKDEVYVDVLELTPQDVPNHKTHLGRIQNNVRNGLTKNQMLDAVADAIQAARDANEIDY